MNDDIVKRQSDKDIAAYFEATDYAGKIRRLNAEVERLTQENSDYATALLDADYIRITAETRMYAAERRVEKLREALKEAIDLRIKLYRNGDILGEDDHISDEQITKKETYARKWSAALAEMEKSDD